VAVEEGALRPHVDRVSDLLTSGHVKLCGRSDRSAYLHPRAPKISAVPHHSLAVPSLNLRI